MTIQILDRDIADVQKVDSDNINDLLGDIIVQMQILNMHMQILSDNVFLEKDIC